MKKQLIVIAIIIMIVVIITVYMFYMYGFNKAKEIAPLINPAARYI
jgi:flagellar basal body-associated protein FliL